MINSDAGSSLMRECESGTIPRDIESGIPQPQFMNVLPYIPNKEFKKTQQRIYEQEQRLFQHQQIIA